MDFQIIPRNDGLTQIALSGRLDVTGVGQVDIRFHGATASQNRSVIVDLSELEFIASLGIGMLFKCHRSLHAKGKKMVLVNPRELVRNSLAITQADTLIPVVATVEEAVALLK